MNTAQTQHITPQLRQWIVEQAEAGFTAEAVLKSMLASGWNEDVAIHAMETTLRAHLDQKTAQKGQPAAQPEPEAAQPELPPAVPVPDPQLDESPLYLDAGDRQ